MQKMKSSNLFESDIKSMKIILQSKKRMFEKNWQEKYDILKQDFDFHVYNSEQSSRLKEVDRNLLNLTLHQVKGMHLK